MLEKRNFAVLMVLPTVAVMVAIVAYPIVYAMWLAFQNWNLRTGRSAFVGLGNFERMLGDSIFWQSFVNTAYYSAATVGLEFLCGLGLALALQRGFRGVAVIRSILLIPVFVVPVVIALMWRILYNQQFGPLVYLLGALHLVDPQDPRWGLSDPNTAMLLIVAASVWQITPFVFLVLVAGMQSIPHEQYEAVRIDGANALQEFLYITLPWLKPLILFILLIRVMDSFKVFDLVIMLTGGGPGSVTEVASLYIYRQAFQYFNLGYASALSLVLLAVVFVFSAVLVKLMTVQRHV